MMLSLRSRLFCHLLGLLLLGASCAGPAAQQDSTTARSEPSLSAQRPSLLWLVDQDDFPLVSRRLMLLEDGQVEARTVLQPLLYCFDAASPDGSKLLAWNNFQLDLWDLEGEDLQHAEPLMQLGRPRPSQSSLVVAQQRFLLGADFQLQGRWFEGWCLGVSF